MAVTATIGDFITAFSECIKTGDILGKVFTGIGKAGGFVLKVVGTLAKGIAALFDFVAYDFVFPGINSLVDSLRDTFDGMANVGDSAEDMGDKVSAAISSMGDAIRNSKIFGFFSTLWQGIKTIGSAIGKVFRNIFGGLWDTLANADLMEIF